IGVDDVKVVVRVVTGFGRDLWIEYIGDEPATLGRQPSSCGAEQATQALNGRAIRRHVNAGDQVEDSVDRRIGLVSGMADISYEVFDTKPFTIFPASGVTDHPLRLVHSDDPCRTCLA